MSRTICGECEHFDPDYDPYGLFDGYCDLYERGRNKKQRMLWKIRKYIVESARNSCTKILMVLVDVERPKRFVTAATSVT